jgi:hypothetical protein
MLALILPSLIEARIAGPQVIRGDEFRAIISVVRRYYAKNSGAAAHDLVCALI